MPLFDRETRTIAGALIMAALEHRGEHAVVLLKDCSADQIAKVASLLAVNLATVATDLEEFARAHAHEGEEVVSARDAISQYLNNDGITPPS